MRRTTATTVANPRQRSVAPQLWHVFLGPYRSIPATDILTGSIPFTCGSATAGANHCSAREPARASAPMLEPRAGRSEVAEMVDGHPHRRKRERVELLTQQLL